MDAVTSIEATAAPHDSGPITELIVANQRDCYGFTVTVFFVPGVG